jgi:acyl-CoA synthetase (NDP forming)
LLGSQTPPNGNRVGIIANSGGPAILCAKACKAGGLVVPALPEAVRSEFASFLPAPASTTNPVDLLATASGEDYRRAIRALAAAGAIDALIVIFTPSLVTKPAEAQRAIHRAARELSRSMPVLSVFMSEQSAPRVAKTECIAVPNYPFPEEAARALSLVARYGAWRMRREEPPEVPSIEALADHPK